MAFSLSVNTTSVFNVCVTSMFVLLFFCAFVTLIEAFPSSARKQSDQSVPSAFSLTPSHQSHLHTLQRSVRSSLDYALLDEPSEDRTRPNEFTVANNQSGKRKRINPLFVRRRRRTAEVEEQGEEEANAFGTQTRIQLFEHQQRRQQPESKQHQKSEDGLTQAEHKRSRSQIIH